MASYQLEKPKSFTAAVFLVLMVDMYFPMWFPHDFIPVGKCLIYSANCASCSLQSQHTHTRYTFIHNLVSIFVSEYNKNGYTNSNDTVTTESKCRRRMVKEKTTKSCDTNSYTTPFIFTIDRQESAQWHKPDITCSKWATQLLCVPGTHVVGLYDEKHTQQSVFWWYCVRAALSIFRIAWFFLSFYCCYCRLEFVFVWCYAATIHMIRQFIAGDWAHYITTVKGIRAKNERKKKTRRKNVLIQTMQIEVHFQRGVNERNKKKKLAHGFILMCLRATLACNSVTRDDGMQFEKCLRDTRET